MRVRRLGYAPLAMLLALIGGGTQLGCSSEDCESVNCAIPAVTVDWDTGVVPPDAAIQLCIDEDCAPVDPIQIGGRPSVSRPVGNREQRLRDRKIAVRLVATTVASTTAREWTGRLTGKCCPHIALRVDGDRLGPLGRG